MSEPRRERERDDEPTEPMPAVTPEGEPEAPDADPDGEPEELPDSGDYPPPGPARGDTPPSSTPGPAD
jgi:hypothetical protein